MTKKKSGKSIIIAIIAIAIITIIATPLTTNASSPALALRAQTQMALFNPKGYEYRTTNAKVVKIVKKSGTIKAVKAGKCKIVIFHRNRSISSISIKVTNR